MPSAANKIEAEAAADFETIQDDLAAVKRDLARLMSHLKIGAKDGVNAAAGQLGDEAMHVYETLAAQGERSAKALGRHIEERPLTCLLLAFAAGFLGARLLSR